MSASSFLSLPNEVLHGIVRQVDASDLATLSLCCSALHGFIRNNRLLYKQIYLRFFDDPCRDPQMLEPSWEKLLVDAVQLQKMLQSGDFNVKRTSFTFIAKTIISLLNSTSHATGPSLNIPFLAALFEKRINIDTLLCCSSLFETAGCDDNRAAPTAAEQQLSAQLHSLYGVPVLAREDDSVPTHPYACSRVYDLRRYTDRTQWGPFQDDGSMRVDWEKVEAVMIVLGHNLLVFREKSGNRFPEIWKDPFAAATPYSYHPAPSLSPSPSAGLSLPPDLKDPYNITGTWMRIVCFLDYSELFAFNFARDPPPTDEDREPLDTEEAIRLIKMQLKATSVEPPGEQDGQSLPVVHFRGTSRSMHTSWDVNANSDIKGSVRLTPHGDIRWTTYSIYYGEERWKSEGIQVGGIQSARGVFGNWFDKDYDDHGPAGPTAFWKVNDDPPEDKQPRTLH